MNGDYEDEMLSDAVRDLPEAKANPQFVARVLAAATGTEQCPRILPATPASGLRERVVSGTIGFSVAAMLLLGIGLSLHQQISRRVPRRPVTAYGRYQYNTARRMNRLINASSVQPDSYKGANHE